MYHRVCVLNYKLLYKCAESRPGKVLTENILDTRRKKGKTILQEALDSSGLACDLSTFEAFLKCLIRQIKHTLCRLNICDHIQMYSCPGQVEISARRADPSGAIYWFNTYKNILQG